MLLHKIEIAKRQIETSAEIYFSGGDHISVITLAGAAEEIIGAFIRRPDFEGKAMIDHLIELDKNLTGGREFSVVNQEINGTRNALKHANNPDEDTVEVGQRAAIQMLSRAVTNYLTLTGELTPPMWDVYHHLRELYPEVVG